MDAVKLGGTASGRINAVELGGMEYKQNNDDIDMARLGKSPVLKVWRAQHASPRNTLYPSSDEGNSETLASCPFWASVARYLSLGKGF